MSEVVDVQTVQEQLHELLGVRDLPVEDRDMVITDLMEVIFENALSTLMMELPKEEAQSALQTIERLESADDMMDFLFQRYTNFPQIIGAEADLVMQSLDEILTALYGGEDDSSSQ